MGIAAGDGRCVAGQPPASGLILRTRYTEDLMTVDELIRTHTDLSARASDLRRGL